MQEGMEVFISKNKEHKSILENKNAEYLAATISE